MMSEIDKLTELLSRCKCGVFLTVNEHRDYYQTAEKALEEMEMERPPQIEPEVRKIMVDTDTIVELQFYPNTPISSYKVYHYDLNAALTKALECFK